MYGTPVIEVLREVTPEDLTAPVVRRTSSLDRVRAIHHMQAKLLAYGKSPTAVAMSAGCSINVLYSLLEDPMFQELLEYYKSQVTEILITNAEKAAVVGRMALDLLQERMELHGEKISIRELREIAETMGDRSDFAKKSPSAVPAGAQQVITFNFDKQLRPTQAPVITIEAEDK